MNKKRLLIIRCDGIGDFVIYSAVLAQYAGLYSEYRIDILCDHKTKELAESIPFISKVFCLNPFRIKHKKYLLHYAWTLFLLNLRNYDLIIYPHYSRREEDEAILRLVRAKEKIAFDGNASNDPGNKRLMRNKYLSKIIRSEGEKPEIERNAEFIARLGAKIDPKHLRTKIWFNQNDGAEAKALLESHRLAPGQYVCIFPGAGFQIRFWDNKAWAQVIEQLRRRYPELKIAILGYGNDSVPINAILQELSPELKTHVINLYSKTKIRVLAKVIELSRLFIGMETGAAHMAAAVNTPNVCIIGGGHFGRFYPYGDLSRNRTVFYKMDCYSCDWRCIYEEAKCIKNIKSEEVMREVDLLMYAKT